MPIRPENKNRYPANWATEIRPRILERAGHRCEQCFVPNYAVVMRGIYGDEGTYQMESTGVVFNATTGEDLGFRHAQDFCWLRTTRIVLTISHNDHMPENCTDENLRALCQRCHLLYDIDHHQATRAKLRFERKAIGQLFENEELTNAN